MIRIFLYILILLGSSQKTFAVYDVNENCKRAWMLLMDLKIDQAKGLMAEEIKRNPENYYCYYLDQTCDAFRLIITSGDADYNAFVENFARKRKIMDGKDESSPYYLLCLAEMEIQLTVFNVMHGSQMAGVNKGVAAYKDLYRNIEKFPQFKPNRKLDGFFNVAIANLPPFVKWALTVMSVKVDIKYGFKTLLDYYQSQKTVPGINAEAALYAILAAKINKTPEMLYDFTNSLDTTISNTFIHQYFRANIAFWSGKSDEAIRTLRQTDHDQNNYTAILYNYMMGKLLMRKLDPGAEYYFSKYLGLIRKKEYFKEINYNLALYWLIKGDLAKYKKYCEIVRTQGLDLNERDREALYDASLDYTPDVNLVKAKLSLDGGYADAYRKAITEFETGHPKVPAFEMEYHLLKGRFAALTANDNLAMAEFRKVIELGGSSNYYFASEAAYRLGDICRRLGQNTLAKDYYKQSIKLYKKNYYEYIDDKASKGLNSLPGS
jgi:hypothetical protein